MRPLRVAMFGPSLAVRGGMSSVTRLMLERVGGPEVTFEHVPTHEDGSRLHKSRVFARALSGTLGRLARGEADLLHIHFTRNGSAWRKAMLLLAGRAFGKPVVLHAHSGEFAIFLAALPRPLRRALCRVLAEADCLIALGDGWKAFYAQELGLAPDRIVVLPNPVALPEALPDRSGRAVTTIAYTGYVGEYKGAFALIEALARLPEDVRCRHRLVLAGNGEVDTARRLAAEHGVDALVATPGWIGPAERDALLAEADVFALPSRGEALPMAVLEAMAWGLPVIATPVGSVPEFVHDGVNGLMVPPADAEALTEALLKLDADPAWARSLGAAGRATVEPLAVEHYAERLHRLYRQLVDRAGFRLVPASPCKEP